jgi:cytidylate kinase
MSDQGQIPLSDLQVDGDNLYREVTYTDLRVATIRMFEPVKKDGSPDESRTAFFSAETQVMTQGGALPVQTALEVNTLAEAIEAFPAAIRAAVERMMDELRELQRAEASRIVLPGRDTGGKIDLS